MAKKKKSLKTDLPYSQVMVELIEQLANLPGIGAKSAEKLAYHILTLPKQDALKIAKAIENVKEKMTYCEICFNLTDKSPCEICRDETRDKSVICVVEQPKDLWAIEKTGKISFFKIREAMYGESFWETLLIPIRMFFQGKDTSYQYFQGSLNPILIIFLPFAFLYKGYGKDKFFFISFTAL